MKKRYLFVLILLLVNLSLVSAVYECVEGFKSDREEISVGNEKSINNIGIGVIYASESSVLSKVSAEILVDAEKITLTNASNTEEVELLSGNYDLEMINVSDPEIIIKVESDSETIEVGEVTSIDDIYAYLSSAEGSYPGEDGKIGVILGVKKIELSNTDNPEELVVINSEKYLIELVSASRDEASIKVKTCSGDITEVMETETNETDDIPIVNDTEITNENDEQETSNKTEPIKTEEGTIEEADKSLIEIPVSYNLTLFIVIITSIIIIYFWNKSRKKAN